jgi:hypothetical protein
MMRRTREGAIRWIHPPSEVPTTPPDDPPRLEAAKPARGPLRPTLGRILALLLLGALPHSGVMGGMPAPPTNFKCVIETKTSSGKTREAFLNGETQIERVFQSRGAYRIESFQGAIRGTPENVRLNNGDGSDTEFLYHPLVRRAVVNLNTVRWKFSQKHPDVWRAKGSLPATRPTAGALTFFGDSDIRDGKKVNPTFKIDPPTRETVDGKRCQVFTMRYQELKDRSGRTDPQSSFTRKVSVWLKFGIVLRDETLAEFLGNVPPRPLEQRTVRSIRGLVVDQTLPAGLFELPAGTTCEVFGDYETRLPRGVLRKTIAGAGLDL